MNQTRTIESLKNDEKCKKKLDIEGRIPTMSFMYLRDFTIKHFHLKGQEKIFKAHYKPSLPCICPKCQSEGLKPYDYYYRKAQFINEEGAIRKLNIKAKRYRCDACNYLFREPIAGLRPKKQSSTNFRLKVIKNHDNQMSNKKIAEELRISESTVERIIHEQYKDKQKEALQYQAPIVLGIDEHTISKGKYATTIADLRNHRIYDVIEGKTLATIESVLMKYPGRLKVKVVCMDLSSSFRKIARHCFPNAMIVADRFHVIRMIQHHFMEFAKKVQEEIKWKRPIIRALRTKRGNLNSKQKSILEELFKANESLKIAYEGINELMDLLRKKTQKAKACKRLIPKLLDLIDRLKKSPEELTKIANTLTSWLEPVARMWRFTKSNGITEGFHRKMKLIQRRAYGFRNFENYKLRVLVECGGFTFGNREK